MRFRTARSAARGAHLRATFVILPPAALALATALALPASAQTSVGCSTSALVSAIEAANANGDADTLSLASGCTYSFTTSNSSDVDGANALPAIASPITIVGNGAQIERDEAGAEMRLLKVMAGATLVLSDVMLRNGLIQHGGELFARGGGAMRNAGTATLVRVTVRDSSVTGGFPPRGGAIYNEGALALVDSFVIRNVTFHCGQPGECIGEGAGLFNAGGVAAVTNSTIAGNLAASTGGGVFRGGGTVTITNSIVWSNSSGLQDVSGTTYSVIQGGAAGVGNVDADPRFVDPGGDSGDYHLLATSPFSPAINAGSNAALPDDVTDVDGDGDVEETLPWDFDGQERIAASTVDMGADEVPCGGYAFPHTVAAGDEAGLIEAITCANAAGTPSAIELVAGTYSFTAASVIDVDVGDTALPWITGNVTIHGNGAVIERAAGSPAFRLLAVDLGGTLGLDTVRISGGDGPVGSGVLVFGTARIFNSTVSGNSASGYGAGVLGDVESTLLLVNSNVTGNDVTGAGGQGGGVWAFGTSTIVNSTIAGNDAEVGSGLYSAGATTVANSIVWDNAGADIVQDGGSLTVSASIVEGGWPGAGNLDEDPLFVSELGDYHLQSASPAIDAGDDAAVAADLLDLDDDGITAEPVPYDVDGDARLAGGSVDMGADEAPQAVVPQADLSITKTDGVTVVDAGSSTTYVIVVTNAGPGDAPGTVVTDHFPDECALGSYTSSATGGATGNNPGPVNGDIEETLSLPASSTVTYEAECAVGGFADGTLSNTATVAPDASVTDTSTGIDAATDVDTIMPLGNAIFADDFEGGTTGAWDGDTEP